MLLSSRPLDPINEATLRAVERAVAALRRGEIVAIEAADGSLAAALSAEMLSDETVRRIARLTGGQPVVAVTGRRAAVIGAADEPSGVVTLGVPGGVSANSADVTQLSVSEADAGENRDIRARRDGGNLGGYGLLGGSAGAGSPWVGQSATGGCLAIFHDHRGQLIGLVDDRNQDISRFRLTFEFVALIAERRQ